MTQAQVPPEDQTPPAQLPVDAPGTGKAAYRIPRTIAGYQLVEKIGQGGMGTVFKAKQTAMDRWVALKVLPPRLARVSGFIERFQREAKASASIDHPHLVRGIDAGCDERSGLWYFAMEFVPGRTLRAHQEEAGGALPVREALHWCRQVALGLAAAHRAGVVHRDLKPDNVLIAADGTAKIADLGLAKRRQDDTALTMSGQPMGTPLYMAPELAQAQHDRVDGRTDLYALGVMLFHLVTGRPPFDGDTVAQLIVAHMSQPPPRADAVAPRVPRPVADLIDRLLRKDPAERPQSADVVVAAIDHLLRGATAAPEVTTVRTRRWRAVPKRLALLGGGIALVAAVVLAWWPTAPPQQEPTGPAVDGRSEAGVAVAAQAWLEFRAGLDAQVAVGRIDAALATAAPDARWADALATWRQACRTAAQQRTEALVVQAETAAKAGRSEALSAAINVLHSMGYAPASAAAERLAQLPQLSASDHFLRRLDAFDVACFSDRRLSIALQEVEAMARDLQLAEQVAPLRGIAAAMAEERTRRVQALRPKLNTVINIGNYRAVTLLEVVDDGLRVQVPRAEGRVERHVPGHWVTADQRRRLMGDPPVPTTATQRAALGLMAVIDDDLPAAKALLDAAAPELSLAAHWRDRVARELAKPR